MTNDKRENEVIRVCKRPSNYVMIDKTFLEDDRLSYKAKGILAYLLSKPDDWKVIVGNLVNNSTDGKAAVYAGLKELKECGYYKKVPIRNESGTRIVRWESTVYEVPFSLLTDFQEVENQDIENQFIENRERNNNYNTNTIYITNNNSQSCLVGTDVDSVECYKSILLKNIDYQNLKIKYKDDVELINEFVSIALDAILSKNKTVKINGEDKPRDLVRANLLQLKFSNIELVLRQFKNHDIHIQKKAQYILSMLYYSVLELNAHYTNLVSVDMSKGKI